MELAQPHGENASQHLRKIPPMLRMAEGRTMHESNNPRQVNGNFVKLWITFEADIRPYLEANRSSLNTAMVARHDTPELVLAAEEIGVQGRFMQHIAQPVSTCLRYIQGSQAYTFGDLSSAPAVRRKCQGGGGKPDLLVIEVNVNQASLQAKASGRIIGEVKTPWTMNLDETLFEETTQQLLEPHLLSGVLGM